MSAAEPLAALADLLGPRGLITAPADIAPYAEDWRRLYRGRPHAVLRPANTAELAAAVGICAGAGLGIVPQGGNTSMVGGATPSASGGEVVLALSRLNRVRAIDPVDLTLTIEAGATVKAAQDAAAAAGCQLPLSIASEGSATIGGVLSTNAGGNMTLRYGNARDLVLGLEVVLADGRVWEGLRRLRKDNTGYCLRQIFLGAEGTLGIITAAVLKLVPAPRQRVVAFAALPSAEAALSLLTRCQRHDQAALVAFEYMGGHGMELVLQHIPDTQLPLAAAAEHYALVEFASSRAEAGFTEDVEEMIAQAMAAGEVRDATLAASEAQARAIWRLREEHAEAQKRAGASIKNDVSVPVSLVPEFLRAAPAACRALMPGIRVVAFGHLGDGNIHFNLRPPETMAEADFLAQDHAVMDAVLGVVRRLGGSFSAEHGVGRLKTYLMPDWRGGVELDLMRALKTAFDPHGLLNAGKIFP